MGETAAWPYTYAILDVNALTVDESYQRPLTSFVRRIEGDFDPALVGTLVVSHREDGDLVVVDGQTRAAAIGRLAADGKVAGPGAPCLVYEGLSQADEARLFARLQKERRGIASYHRFRAAVVAGEPEAIAIQALAEAAGHELGEAPKLSAVAALERVYRRDPKVLERTFVVLREAWGPDYVPSGDMLRGVGRLLHTMKTRDARLARRLQKVTPGYVKRLALESSEGSAGSGGGFEGHVADALEAIYHGYESEIGQPARTCKAKTCGAVAARGSEYCPPHAAQAAELRRRLKAAA